MKSTPNPRRVAAGKLNRAKRRGLTPAGVERLRQAALRDRPWEHATGPLTQAGKAKSAANGRWRQRGAQSIREVRRELAGLGDLFAALGGGCLIALRTAGSPAAGQSEGRDGLWEEEAN